MWMLAKANGYALDAGGSRFDAVVCDGDRVVAVGTEADLRLQFGARLERVCDVDGATVLPGFIDSHLHVAALGEQAVRLDVSGVHSAAELLDRVAARAAKAAPGTWILGGGWDDNRFAVPGLPTLDELDRAAGGRPLLLTRVCHHAYLANRAAFAAAGLGDQPADPPDGRYGRDAAGRLNGLVYENASRPLLRAVPARSPAEWRAVVKAGMQRALSHGITAVHTDDVRSLGSFQAVWETYWGLIHEDGVRLRVHELVDWHALDEYRSVLSALPGPDAWLDRGAAKLFSDGALGGRTAWLSAPYTDDAATSGTPMYSPDELAQRVAKAHANGFGAAIHAIGDAAVDVALRAMAASPRAVQRDRLIHAEIVRPDLVERMRGLGEQLAVDVQPRFTVSDFPWIVDRIGPERARLACAWQTLRGAGLHLAGGSDAPIEPVAPLLGVHAAVFRRLPGADHPGYEMQEALDVVAALRLFTQDAAYAAGREHEQGVVAPGFLADFTVVDGDVVADPERLASARVLYTIVGGEVASAAEGAAGAAGAAG
ncbi:MAG: amidohydrolase [Alicyclobacillus sp.]|nr:amidohydrolase [Alicyclobacillus sp.]